jgi:hypothetical protein
MFEILSHKRFWLFAPFIGLLALVLVAFGLWHYASARIIDQLAAQGVSWQRIEAHGFPTRLSFELDKARRRQNDILWTNEALSLTLMPFKAGHVIADFKGTHRLEHPKAKLALSHNGNLASLVGDANGLLRSAFEAQAPRMMLSFAERSHKLSADTLSLHARRSASAGAYDIALMTKNLSLPPSFGRASAQKIARLDVRASVPEDFAKGRARAGQKLVLDRLTLERGGLTFIARGTIKLAANGHINGKLDLEAIKLEALLDVLQELELVSPRERAKWLFLGGLGAALGNTTQDRLSVPLHFKNKRTLLGPLDLGPAPHWQ